MSALVLVGARSRGSRLDLGRQFADGSLQIGVVPREPECHIVLRERASEIAAPMAEVGKPPNRDEVVRGLRQHPFELDGCPIEIAHFHEGARECNSRGQVTWMDDKSSLAY